jgi:hypothetical protein
MKKTFLTLLISIIATTGSLWSQDVTTVTATDSDISENLDLNAVASVFGESENLEDFEKKLNDPDKQISNIDLNGDGEVDYLRVVETSKEETHLVAIQAVIGKDQFQDVATIEVEKDSSGESTVQVVGDVYMYGPDYIVQPVYVSPPVIFVFFWGPLYHPWRSPYYYGYYPPYYRPWRPYPTPVYRTNVHVHVNVNNSYNRTTVRHSRNASSMQKQVRRNDYAKANPNSSYQKRKPSSSNRQNAIKESPKSNNAKSNERVKSTGKPVNKNFDSGNKSKTTKQTKGVNEKARSTKKTKSTPQKAKPAKKPTTQPNARPAQRSAPKNTAPKKRGGGKR